MATPWRQKRPRLDANARAPAIAVAAHRSGAPTHADPGLQGIAAMGAERAGLKLNDEEFALLVESTPYALALAKRIPHNHGNGDELATTFVPA